MTTTTKKPSKAAAKVGAGKVVRASTGGVFQEVGMTQEQLHRDMVAYGKKVTATKASALAFLKRIGAPV
jgi:hypothetical protein